jgi:hypothetical protein
MTHRTPNHGRRACCGLANAVGCLVTAGIVGLAISLSGCRGADPVATAPSPSATSVPAPQPTANAVTMRGTVSDGAFRDIPGARIEILDGPQTGTTTISDRQGQFSFGGTIDDSTRFRATSAGYLPSIATSQTACGSCNPPRWVHFALNAVAPSVNMAGDYTVTFTSACAGLPADVRTRVYEATIGSPPYNGSVFVPLKGGTFIEGWDGLPMGVESDYVAFWLELLVEQIAPHSYLTFNALAAAHVEGQGRSTYAFPLEGTSDYCVTTDTGSYNDCLRTAAVKRVSCGSVLLTLTRR